MTKRERYVDYVKNGGEKFCSPQIGAGAGFDTKMAGKEWVSETTMEDTIRATEQFDMLALYNFGLPDASFCNPDLAFKNISFEDGEERKSTYEFVCEKGRLERQFVEHKYSGTTPISYPVQDEEDLDVFEWFLDESLKTDLSPITDFVKNASDMIGDRGAVSLQWGMQPYELFSWPDTVTAMFLANDCTEKYLGLMDKIVELDFKFIECCAKGGADFVFLGTPAAEIISPRYFEEFIVPYSKIVTAEAHRQGLLVYSHVCSPIEPMLTNGYFNEMGIDLFETLSMPPVGNVESLADALSKLDPKICTRGNIGLDLLINETPERIEQECFTALKPPKAANIFWLRATTCSTTSPKKMFVRCVILSKNMKQ